MLALLFDDGTLAPRHLFSSHFVYNFRLVPARLRSLRKKKKKIQVPYWVERDFIYKIFFFPTFSFFPLKSDKWSISPYI